MDFDIDKLKEFSNIELLAKQLVEGFITGLHKSPYHGFSVEFAEHRLYNYGESTRHIDWKVFAKTDSITLSQDMVKSDFQFWQQRHWHFCSKSKEMP